MFKQTLLAVIACFALVHTSTANSHCSKNAWVVFSTTSKGNGQTCGQMSISSGQGAQDLPTVTAMKAISDCAYSNNGCTGTWVGNSHWEFCCNESPGWKNYYSGSMNIEFSCTDGPYTCYDLHWN
jgi:hypothetical protein